MTKKRIQAPHKMKCEHCDVGFAKLVKSDELINGKKHCVYYCEHCKNYQLYEQVEHQPKRFTATTSRGLYCWDNVTGKRYDAVDDFFEMMDLLNDFNDENTELKMITNLFSDRELRRLQQFEQKVKETLQKHYDKSKEYNHIDTERYYIGMEIVKKIAYELGVELND